jgi:hypothetical protein
VAFGERCKRRKVGKMNTDINTIRLLGAAQLIVFVASMLSERLLASAVGSGGISDKLVNISNNLTLMRISNLVALVNCLGIVVLGVLFYIVFNEEYKIIALVALGSFLAEAITLAVSKLGAFALIPLSQQFVEVGAPEPSCFQTLCDFLYHGVDRRGYDIHMLFFCLGGILWYYLFYVSRCIPRALSVWGLAAVCLLSIPVLVGLYDRDFTSVLVLGLPYAPYELFLGVWLIIKGFN